MTLGVIVALTAIGIGSAIATMVTAISVIVSVSVSDLEKRQLEEESHSLCISPLIWGIKEMDPGMDNHWLASSLDSLVGLFNSCGGRNGDDAVFFLSQRGDRCLNGANSFFGGVLLTKLFH